MDRWRIYRVRIVYTEPAFQVRLAAAPDVYSIDYLVRDAASPEEAVQAAMREWRHCAANSRVGWGRFIESIVIGHDAPGRSPDGWEISCVGREPRAVEDGGREALDRRHPQRRWS